ncbi:DUF481 domain-containing protein [Dokdonella sp.]|uniref:DUF481 domain-containing protein n=1 Tax=Dokdonella sp. TaxID=2291710 RepID=UPI003C608F02
MKRALLASAMLLAFPFYAHAHDPAADEKKAEEKKAEAKKSDEGWSGSGEAGFAATSGNTRSENLNIKFNIKKEDPLWKYGFYFNALRSKGEANGSYDVTANRYETGASTGYKFDERSYVVGAARYEDDEFSPYTYQFVLSLSYGYTVLKNPNTEFFVEIGPGYRRLDPQPYEVISGDPPTVSEIDPDAEDNFVGRGLMAYKHKFNDSTSFENISLVEAGSNNTYFQNDAGLSVSMSDRLALKLGYQIRHNSDVREGLKKTDQLVTTNVVFKF